MARERDTAGETVAADEKAATNVGVAPNKKAATGQIDASGETEAAVENNLADEMDSAGEEDAAGEEVVPESQIVTGHVDVRVPELSSSTLLVRILSGSVYVVVNVLALYLGSIATATLMAITAGVTCWEFYRVMRSDAKLPNQAVGLFFAVALPFLALTNPVYLIGGVFLLILVLGIWYVTDLRVRITDLSVTVFGVLYTSLMLCSVVLIRSAAPAGLVGFALCAGMMASVWANDSCAYLVGSHMGRHKLVPKISPKKSWEGLAGGIAGSVLIWVVVSLAVPGTGLPPAVAVLAGVACGITGVIGDLVESRIKRGAGIKDSGRIMPGHGGLLDRSDSLLFVGVTAYFILRMTGVL